MSTQHTPKTRLHSMNFSGNLHDVARGINKLGWSDFFVQAESTGNNSVVLLRLPIDWPFDDRGPLTTSQIAAATHPTKSPDAP
jgi:hypothetical protein